MQRFLTGKVLFTLILGVGVAGCGKDGSSGGGGTASTNARSGVGPVETVRQAAQTVATQAQQVVKTVEETAQQAQQAAVQATGQAQAMLDQAKVFLAEKKVQDAAGVLSKLAGVTLNSEQQKVLTDMKGQLSQLGAEIERGFGELKTCVAQKKYTEASTLVTRLTSYQLSPDQQKLLEDLKAQVNKLVGTGAADQGSKAASDLLKR